MCLTKVTRKKGIKYHGVGYKAFRIVDGKLYSPIYFNGKEYKFGTWIHEHQYRPKYAFSSWSKNHGFYIFRKKRDAMEFAEQVHEKVYKVEWKDPICCGYQDDVVYKNGKAGVVVAKRIKIIGEQ